MKIFNVFLFLSFLFLISCDKTENNVDTQHFARLRLKILQQIQQQDLILTMECPLVTQSDLHSLDLAIAPS